MESNNSPRRPRNGAAIVAAVVASAVPYVESETVAYARESQGSYAALMDASDNGRAHTDLITGATRNDVPAVTATEPDTMTHDKGLLPEMFVKVRFVSATRGATVGMIVPEHKFRRMSVSEVSRIFPHFEALKMEVLEVSRTFDTWESAFEWREWETSTDVRRIRVNPTMPGQGVA